jgi:GrpB-like predicted nucleotidyltransferase (UPF0157 family)
MRLIPSDSIQPQASRILTSTRERLRALDVPGELMLVGGSSVPGALTRGDVDLHLRVEPTEFPNAVRDLERHFTVAHPEIWTDTLAAFELRDDLPVGIAVTPAGSEHDIRFTRCWQLLAADPSLVLEYNGVKRSAPAAEYEVRKSAFFDRLLEAWQSHPAGAGHAMQSSG